MLSKITEFGSDGTSTLPSVDYTYSTLASGYSTPSISLPAAMYYQASDNSVRPQGILRDFNGDGIIDYSKATCYEGGSCDLKIYLGTGNGFVDAGYNLPAHVYYHYNDGRVKVEGTVQDLNGDGKADFSAASKYESGTTNTKIFFGTGTNFIDSGFSLPGHLYYHYANGAVKTEGILFDMNGDGLADFSVATNYENGSSDLKIYLGTGTGFSDSGYTLPGPVYYQLNDGSVRSAGILQDIDGDGIADFSPATLYENGTSNLKVYLGSNTGFAESGYELPGHIYYQYNDGRVKNEGILVDFNGDGKPDFSHASAYENGTNKLEIFWGTGNGFVPSGFSLPGHLYYHANDGTVKEEGLLQDFNSDGLIDFSVATAYENGTSNLSIYYGTGNGFVDSGLSLPTHVYYQFNDGKVKTEGLIQDLNGDGMADFSVASSYESGSNNLAVYANQGSLAVDKLVEVKGREGSKTIVEYTLSNRFSSTINTNISQYPVLANTSARYLVKKETKTDGRGGNYSTSYDYTDGRFYIGSADELADLGFASMKVTNDQTGSYMITTFHQDKPYQGRILEKTTYTAAGQIANKESYTYDFIHPHPETDLVLVKSVFKKSYENNQLVFERIQQFSSYDQYGNPLVILDQATNTDTIKTEMSYQYDESNWSLSTPIEVKLSANDKLLQWQKYVFDGARLIEKNEYLDTEQRWITTKFEYDNFGNITSITNPVGSQSTIVYDDEFHALPIVIENALGHKIRKAYDFRGQEISSIDANNNETRKEYDVFGRPTKIIEPGDDWTKEILYVNYSDPQNQYQEMRLRDNSQNGYQWSRVYVDGLNRKYKTMSEWDHRDGMELATVQTFEYDSAGRLWKESNKYVPEYDQVYYTTFTYDSLDRVIKKSFSDGTNEVVSFQGNVTTQTDRNGHSQKIYKDARGRITRKTDPNGSSVLYVYDGMNRLTRVTDVGGAITVIQYDSLGRKISILDPNSGLRKYSYNDLGKVTTMKDARGTEIKYQYDALGRIIKEDLPNNDQDIVYTYDEKNINNGIGRLTKVTDESGSSTFAYDPKGNQSNLIKSIDGMSFAFGYTYNAMKKMETISYPNDIKIRYLYAENGNLHIVQVNNRGKGKGGRPIVKYQRPSSDTEILRKMGNGVSTTIKYDPRNKMPKQITTKFKSQVIQDWSYEHDPIGHITEIRDHLNDQASQTFQYDSLYRLVSATGIYGQKSYTYSPNGNILSKGDLQLDYTDANHPHAVSSDSQNNSYQYDSVGNMSIRQNDILIYDSKNRLKSLAKNGIDQESYKYDFTGLRIRKVQKDGSTVYSISGLYELVKFADGRFQITNYVKGMKGELVAQATKTVTESNFAKIHVPAVNKTIASTYNPFTIDGFVLKIYFNLKSYDISLYIYWKIVKILLIFVILLAVILYILNLFKPRFWTLGLENPMRQGFVSALNHFVLAIFISSFIVLGTGCAGKSGDSNGNPPHSGYTQSGIDDSTSQFTEPDAFPGFPVSGLYFFHPDHLGSISMMTGAEGNVLSRVYYKPFGELDREHSEGYDIFRYKYTSQEEDTETGLYYYKGRYYDAKIGRFITADSIVPDPMRSQAFNRYSYVENNPIAFTDPTGHWSVSIGPVNIGSGGVSIDGYTGPSISDIGQGIVNGVTGFIDGVQAFFSAAGSMLKSAAGLFMTTFVDPVKNFFKKIGNKINGTFLNNQWWQKQINNTIMNSDWWKNQFVNYIVGAAAFAAGFIAALVIVGLLSISSPVWAVVVGIVIGAMVGMGTWYVGRGVVYGINNDKNNGFFPWDGSEAGKELWKGGMYGAFGGLGGSLLIWGFQYGFPAMLNEIYTATGGNQSLTQFAGQLAIDFVLINFEMIFGVPVMLDTVN